MSETAPEVDVPDLPDVDTASLDAPDVDTPDMDSQDALAAEDAAALEEAVQQADPDQVTTDAHGNTVLKPGIDPYDVLGRDANWPDGLADRPDGWLGMTPDERSDWLAGQDWAGAVSPAGYPVPGAPAWGDPTAPAPVDGPLLTEPGSPAGRTRAGRPMGGPEAARQASRDAEDAGKHGQVKGIGGGSAKKKKRAPLGAKVGRGDGTTGGRGGGNSLISLHFFQGAGSGNSLVKTGDVATVKPSGNSLICGPGRPGQPRAAGAKFGTK